MKNVMKRLVKRILAFWYTPLPVGVEEFEVWAKDIIFTYELPDNDSVRFSLAMMICHSGSTESTKPKRYFGRSAGKAGANQVAAYMMHYFKEKQKKAEADAAHAASLKEIDEQVQTATDSLNEARKNVEASESPGSGV